MEPTPWLRNRRTGVILPYNPHLATHPDMVACEELPYPKEVKKPTTPTHRRYLAAQAAKEAAAKTEQKATAPAKKVSVRKKAVKAKPKAKPESESPGDAEIDDLLAGIDHG